MSYKYVRKSVRRSLSCTLRWFLLLFHICVIVRAIARAQSFVWLQIPRYLRSLKSGINMRDSNPSRHLPLAQPRPSCKCGVTRARNSPCLFLVAHYCHYCASIMENEIDMEESKPCSYGDVVHTLEIYVSYICCHPRCEVTPQQEEVHGNTILLKFLTHSIQLFCKFWVVNKIPVRCLFVVENQPRLFFPIWRFCWSRQL